jgi:RimJ/RimL family protein N-acetyltransferase
MKVGPPCKKSIINHLTGAIYHIFSCDESFVLTYEDIQRIVEVCNQEAIYNLLFKERLGGKAYELENAEGFISWAKEGWNTRGYFVFLVRDENERIVGALDIKSANIESAEIGYWASADSPGFMTNAVRELVLVAKEMGYKQLYAFVKPSNSRSANVLIRAGFQYSGEVSVDSKTYKRYELLTKGGKAPELSRI